MKRVLAIILVLTCIVVMLSGCKSKNEYEKALEYENNCMYKEASEIYLELGSYKDSYNRYISCTQKQAIEETINEYKKNESVLSVLGYRDDYSKYYVDGERILDDNLYSKGKAQFEKLNVIKDAVTLVDDLESLQTKSKTLEETNYDILIDESKALLEELKESAKQYTLVRNPSPEYVISCLKRIGAVKEIEEATEDVDPNQGLSKEDGYTSNIFFKLSWVKDESVQGKSPLECGTAGGGCIEIYRNEGDAGKRNSDLVLSRMQNPNQGEYEIYGTLVIRLSPSLSELQGKLMLEQIEYELVH